MIESGELQPGDQLLPERKLAEAMSASRTAVREALAALSGAGVIELTGQGAIVRSRDLEDISGAFGALLAQQRSDVLELLEAREIIESQAAELAAHRREMSDLQRMWLYAAEIEEAIRARADATDPDTNFHSALVASAHNHSLSQVFAVLEGAMRHLYQPTRRVMLLDESLADGFLGEHWGIIEALREQDGARVQTLVRSHIRRAMEFAREGIERQDG
jgi:GntR family transcriptional repressor for pyruvate dehydrogenase complex